MAPIITDEAVEAAPVTRDEAFAFLESACRNWSSVPRLTGDDIDDVAAELTRFAAKRAVLEAAAPHMSGVSTEHDLADEILAELVRARTKFPGKNVTFAALVEEVGELATALFEEPCENVRKEAVQVAVMAMRVILDGDHTFDAWRESKGLDPLSSPAPVATLPDRGKMLKPKPGAPAGGYGGATDATEELDALAERGVEVMRRLSMAKIKLPDASFIASWITDARGALRAFASNLPTHDAAEELEVVAWTSEAELRRCNLSPHVGGSVWGTGNGGNIHVCLVRHSDALALIEKLRAENERLRVERDAALEWAEAAEARLAEADELLTNALAAGLPEEVAAPIRTFLQSLGKEG